MYAYATFRLLSEKTLILIIYWLYLSAIMVSTPCWPKKISLMKLRIA